MARLMFAALAALAGSAQAADGDMAFNGYVEQFQQRAPAHAWRNAWMSWGTGVYAARSADEVLAECLRVYSRDVLDRGYWINAWVGDAPGYSAGNPLLAVAPGYGATLRSELVAEPVPPTRAAAPWFLAWQK
jgi:hypothetical protein